MISMLPPLTRPSAKKDREQVQRFAERAGFKLKRRIRSEAVYESPPFEQKTLQDIGIHCTKPWRVADLYLFQKVTKPTKRLLTKRPVKDVHWLTFRIHGVEIKLRDRNDAPVRKLRIRRLTECGETLGSVSRRYKGREHIDLWTSNNVAFSISRTAPIRDALSEAQKGRAPNVIEEIVSTAFKLDSTERSEVRKVLGVLAATPTS